MLKKPYVQRNVTAREYFLGSTLAGAGDLPNKDFLNDHAGLRSKPFRDNRFLCVPMPISTFNRRSEIQGWFDRHPMEAARFRGAQGENSAIDASARLRRWFAVCGCIIELNSLPRSTRRGCWFDPRLAGQPAHTLPAARRLESARSPASDPRLALARRRRTEPLPVFPLP